MFIQLLRFIKIHAKWLLSLFLICPINIVLASVVTIPVEERFGIKGADLRATTKNNRSITYNVRGKTYQTLDRNSAINYSRSGLASFYASKFHGRKTSNGEIYSENLFTAAHKSLPIPSYALITNLTNQRQIVVRINDRGPFIGDRRIDLSKASARELGITRSGLQRVQIDVVHVDAKGNLSGPGGEKLLAKEARLKQNSTQTQEDSSELHNVAESSHAPQSVKVNNQLLQYELHSLNFEDQVSAQKLSDKLAHHKIDFKIESDGDKYRLVWGPILSLEKVNQVKLSLIEEGYPHTVLHSFTLQNKQ